MAAGMEIDFSKLKRDKMTKINPDRISELLPVK